MVHILFIDRLKKLAIKKDSTLMMALTFKNLGEEVYLIFEDDFYYKNSQGLPYKVYDFSGAFQENHFYIEYFHLEGPKNIQIGSDTVFHIRIDPPFDARYLRYMWMIKALKKTGARIINDPDGVLLNNEKLVAYEWDPSLPTYIGGSFEAFYRFVEEQKRRGKKSVILKPLDLYQGLGVEKIGLLEMSKKEWEEKFERKKLELKGPLVAQEYAESVTGGEIRALFFKGKELGSIIKIPPEGSYLANIASGARYEKIELGETHKKKCFELCLELGLEKVPWVAFDILGDTISEANITCPGLLVEVSEANGKNLALEILRLI